MSFLILLHFQMRGLAREHLVDIVAKFEPCPENLQRMVLGIDGMGNYLFNNAYDHHVCTYASVTLHMSLGPDMASTYKYKHSWSDTFSRFYQLHEESCR